MFSDTQFIETPEMDRAGSAIGAKYDVALFKQKLSEVGAVLSCDARYDCTVSVVRHGGVSFIVSHQKWRALPARFIAVSSLSWALGAQH